MRSELRGPGFLEVPLRKVLLIRQLHIVNQSQIPPVPAQAGTQVNLPAKAGTQVDLPAKAGTLQEIRLPPARERGFLNYSCLVAGSIKTASSQRRLGPRPS